MSDFGPGSWGRPELPWAGAGGSLHEGSGLDIDIDHGGDRWSVSGGYLAVGPDGLHLAPGVVITGSWVIRGPGFARDGRALQSVAAGVVAEYGTRANDGGFDVWPPDNTDYPTARRIGHALRDGCRVLRRRVIVVEDWAEVGAPSDA